MRQSSSSSSSSSSSTASDSSSVSTSTSINNDIASGNRTIALPAAFISIILLFFLTILFVHGQ